jgi:hypothetical protein
LSIFLNWQTLLPVQLSRDVSGHLALGFDAQSGALRLAVNRPDGRAVVNGGERGENAARHPPTRAARYGPWRISNTVHVQVLNQGKFSDLIVTADNPLYFFVIEVNQNSGNIQGLDPISGNVVYTPPLNPLFTIFDFNFVVLVVSILDLGEGDVDDLALGRRP